MPVHESLEHYIRHLREKGFTEDTLGIDKNPPGIEQVLRTAFDKFLEHAKRSGKERAFWLDIPGVFNDDIPKFHFLFVVDPVKEALRLGKIHTSLTKVVDKIPTLDGIIKHTPQQLYRRLLHLKSQNLHEYMQNTPGRTTNQKKRL